MNAKAEKRAYPSQGYCQGDNGWMCVCGGAGWLLRLAFAAIGAHPLFEAF